MRATTHRRLATRILAAGMLVLTGGCTALQVELTSDPETVRAGQPVTFNIKVTNRSACPTQFALAEIVAFIPEQGFLDKLLSDALPPSPPPEFVAFLEQVEQYFDDLCAGETPPFPKPPFSPSIACRLEKAAVLCRASVPIDREGASAGPATVATLGDQLRCENDGKEMSCDLRFPMAAAEGAAASGGGAVVPNVFTCLPIGEIDTFNTASGAVCFLGTFPNLEGLPPGAMATGEVSLPARGSGLVRNLVIAGAGPADDDLGVCKGGSNAGVACNQDSGDPCTGGGTCGEGICDQGGNDGLGCDAATAAADCPGGGTCVLCNDLPGDGLFPIDCTTTYISPEGVPAMSPWGLIGLAALLMVFGTLWLRARARA